MLKALLAYLENDSTLLTLLGGTAENPRMFWDLADENMKPKYLVLSVNQDGGRDEVLDDIVINMNIYTLKFGDADVIAERLKTILDLQDQIVILADNEYIYWSKKVGGDSFYEDNNGLRIYHRVLQFALKFGRKN